MVRFRGTTGSRWRYLRIALLKRLAPGAIFNELPGTFCRLVKFDLRSRHGFEARGLAMSKTLVVLIALGITAIVIGIGQYNQYQRPHGTIGRSIR